MKLSLKPILANIWIRITFLFLTFFFLSLLFVSPPIRYKDDNVAKRPFPPDKESSVKTLIDAEHKKTVEELKFYIESQETWYHYKYLFIGGLLALLLGEAGVARYLDKISQDTNFKPLKDILSDGLIYITLTVACVICIMIDMHIRSHMFSIQSLGLWLAHYVEPSYIATNPNSGFFPWEQFLRSDIFFPEPTVPSSGNSLLTLLIERFAFSMQLNFLTIITYMFYSILLQQICLDFSEWCKQRNGVNVLQFIRSRKLIVILGFVFIQVSLIAFNLVAHAIGGSRYKMQLIPFAGMWGSEWKSFTYYLIPWAIIILLTLPYLLLIRFKEESFVEDETPK